MPKQPVKILELKGEDWIKGISIQDTFALGGIFQVSAKNFDPFELMGFLRATLAPVQIDGATITTAVKYLLAAASGGVGYIFAMGDRSGAGAKSFYRIKTSDLTVTAYTAEWGANIAGAAQFDGLAYYKGRLVYYDSNGNFMSNTFPAPAAGSQVLLLSTSVYPKDGLPPMHKCPDGLLYVGLSNSGVVGSITNVTGAGGNSASAFDSGNSDFVCKDITDDGRYAMFLMDDNPDNATNIASLCQLFVWDMDNVDPQVVITIPDSFVTAARWVDGRLLVWGASGIWQLSVSSQTAKLIFPLPSTAIPAHGYQVTIANNIAHWCSPTSGAVVFAYGAKIGKPIMYSPYQISGSDNLLTALVASGTYFFASLDAGTNTPKVYVQNSGSTRNNLTIETVPANLDQSYKIAYVKVVLKQKMTSGQALALSLFNGADETIMTTNTQSYSANKRKKSIIFKPKPTTSSIKDFDDIYAVINPQGGAEVARVCVYGYPASDNAQIT